MSVASLVHARLPALRAEVRARREADVDVLAVPPALLRPLARFLRDDPDVGCDHLVDVTVVDRGAEARDAGRFVLLVLLTSRAHGSRVRIDVALDDDEPAYPSLVEVWPAARVPERELWEFFGVTPDGHPGLQRLLLPEGFAGHPGRLDYPIAKAQPQAPSPERAAAVVVDAAPTPPTATAQEER
jgi:NADH:ubiquinone oxidoreductase subunit C